MRLCRKGQWETVLERLFKSSSSSKLHRTVHSIHPGAWNSNGTDVDARPSRNRRALYQKDDDEDEDEEEHHQEQSTDGSDYPLQVAIRATCYHPKPKPPDGATTTNNSASRMGSTTTTNSSSSTPSNNNNNSNNNSGHLPVAVVEALVRAHPHHLAVQHRLTGTLLHEAIQYRCSNEVIAFLIQCLLDANPNTNNNVQRNDDAEFAVETDDEHDASCSDAAHCNPVESNKVLRQTNQSDSDKQKRNGLLAGTFSRRQNSISSSSTSKSRDLLCIQDDIGRTALHCLVGRWQRTVARRSAAESSTDRTTWIPQSRTWMPHTDATHTSGFTNEYIGDAVQQNNLSDGCLFKLLMNSCPRAITMVDADGNTPLLLLVQTAQLHDDDPFYNHQESELRDIVQAMVSLRPDVSTQTRNPARNSTRWTNLSSCNILSSCNPKQMKEMATNQSSLSSAWTNVPKSGISLEAFNGVNTPLYYAVLYGRSEETIRVLIDATERHPRKKEYRESSVVVTQYNEVCLHIAVTTKAPLKIWECIVKDDPTQATAMDMYNLTPLDWLWISHVRDWSNLPSQQRQHQQGANHRNDPYHRNQQMRWGRLVSGRRHVPRQFRDLHTMASLHVRIPPSANSRIETSSPVTVNVNLEEAPSPPPQTNIRPEVILRHQGELLCRMNTLLIAAAESYDELEDSSKCTVDNSQHVHCGLQKNEWSLLHAACYVPCPRAMVRMAVLPHQFGGSQQNDHPSCQGKRPASSEGASPSLQCRDGRSGRLPLHYAAGRVGYKASFACGFSSGLQVIQESSPIVDILPLFPQACFLVDDMQQLPLHIAIDTFKRHRVETQGSSSNGLPVKCTNSEDASTNNVENEEDTVIELLLGHFPSALDRRDGKTKLFPWQQAAVGPGSRLSTVFQLLRLNPTIFSGTATSS